MPFSFPPTDIQSAAPFSFSSSLETQPWWSPVKWGVDINQLPIPPQIRKDFHTRGFLPATLPFLQRRKSRLKKRLDHSPQSEAEAQAKLELCFSPPAWLTLLAPTLPSPSSAQILPPLTSRWGGLGMNPVLSSSQLNDPGQVM